MVVPQKKFREIVFQILYAYDFNQTLVSKDLVYIMDQFRVTRRVLYRAFEYVSKITNELTDIDSIIKRFVVDYSFERITRIERNMLRLFIFELKHDMQASHNIAIAESIRLNQKFGTSQGSKFVHAVLDAIIRSEVLHWKFKPALNIINP